jgi:magnesium-transporting ATPase (P-type)
MGKMVCIIWHSGTRTGYANTCAALPEDPPTPIWQLILEQFKDQLVIILLGSAAVSFVLALFEGGDDWTAFVDPAVVSCPAPIILLVAHTDEALFSVRFLLSLY